MEWKEYPDPSGPPLIKCSVHDMEFMTMKYRADLLYSQRSHQNAVNLYRRLLELVPPENRGLEREMRDSLARSLLKVGDGEAARIEAEQLVREN